MLFGTLGASLLGNILAGKGINRAGGEIELVMGLQSKTWIFNTVSSFN